MDDRVIKEMENAGIDTSLTAEIPAIPVKFDQSAVKIEPLEEQFFVFSGKKKAHATFKKISELFYGDKEPPNFQFGPTEEYLLFFCLIERMAADFCKINGKPESGLEFERLYTLLRKKPDGKDPNPLFSYLQAACRFYMSVRDVSRAEFEAVARRLAISARKFSSGYSSVNYHRLISTTLLDTA